MSDPATMLLVVGAVGTALGGLIAGAARWNRKAQEATTVAWMAAARELGGRYVPPGGSWYNRTGRKIEASLDGVGVVIDHYEESTGDSSQTYTRIGATAPSPAGFELSVRDAGLLSALGSAVGVQDVEYGDPPFDDARVVRTSDEDLARRWINRRLRAALLRSPSRVWKLADDALIVRYAGLEKSSQALCELARNAAAFGRRGSELGRAWARLGESLGGASHGTACWPDGARIELPDGVVLEIERSPKRGGSCTLVSLPRSASVTDTWTLVARRDQTRRPAAAEEVDLGTALPEHVVWSEAPERAARRFDAGTTARIRELSPRSIEASTELLTIAVPGLMLERERLESAIELARDLRAGLGAAYR